MPAAAARLARARKPEGAVQVLLAYLPFADNENVADEVRALLAALGVRDGKADKALVEALAHKSPLRRGAAGEARPGRRPNTRPPCASCSTTPSRSCGCAWPRRSSSPGRQAVPVLIGLLADLPPDQAWRAEDVLFRLADGKEPPTVALGNDEARQKCRDAWLAWWKEQGPKIDLAKLHEAPRCSATPSSSCSTWAGSWSWGPTTMCAGRSTA